MEWKYFVERTSYEICVGNIWSVLLVPLNGGDAVGFFSKPTKSISKLKDIFFMQNLLQKIVFKRYFFLSLWAIWSAESVHIHKWNCFTVYDAVIFQWNYTALQKLVMSKFSKKADSTLEKKDNSFTSMKAINLSWHHMGCVVVVSNVGGWHIEKHRVS